MELRRHTLHDAVGASGDSERLFVGDLMNRIALHSAISGTATVTWYGSNLEDPTVGTAADWVELDTSAVSEIAYTDAPIAWVYAAVAWTSGTVTVVLLGNSFG